MNKVLALIIVNFISFSTYNAFSYEVIKIKNKKLLLKFLPDETVQTKDTFYVINNRGKKKAIIIILKVKGSKAIAKILKGKAQVGWSLKLRKRAIAKPRIQNTYSAEPSISRPSYAKKNKKLFNHLSFLWGYASNSLKIGNLSHSDSSVFNFETNTTFFLPKNPMFGLRILSSSENFKLKATCSNGSTNVDCNTDIVYMGGGALAVAQIPVSSKLSVWAGLGLKLLIPLSKTVAKLNKDYNYIDESSIKLTSSFIVSGGLTFNLSPKFSIPLNLNYTMLPSSQAIDSHSIFNVQTGLVYHF